MPRTSVSAGVGVWRCAERHTSLLCICRRFGLWTSAFCDVSKEVDYLEPEFIPQDSEVFADLAVRTTRDVADLEYEIAATHTQARSPPHGAQEQLDVDARRFAERLRVGDFLRRVVDAVHDDFVAREFAAVLVEVRRRRGTEAILLVAGMRLGEVASPDARGISARPSLTFTQLRDGLDPLHALVDRDEVDVVVNRSDVAEHGEHGPVELFPHLITLVRHHERIVVLEAVVRCFERDRVDHERCRVQFPKSLLELHDADVEHGIAVPSRGDELDVVPAELIDELVRVSSHSVG